MKCKGADCKCQAAAGSEYCSEGCKNDSGHGHCHCGHDGCGQAH